MKMKTAYAKHLGVVRPWGMLGAAAVSASSNAMEAATAWEDAWKHANLSQLLHQLEVHCEQIATWRHASVEHRRHLAEKTKQLRKMITDEGMVAELKPLLKGYQGEIDTLSERCRNMDGMMVDIVSRLSSLPDPLEVYQSMEKSASEKAKFDIKGYESTINKLKERIGVLEEDLEVIAQEKVAAAVEASQQELQSLQQSAAKTEEELRGRIETMKQEIAEMRTLADAAQERWMTRMNTMEKKLAMKESECLVLEAELRRQRDMKSADAKHDHENVARLENTIKELQKQLEDQLQQSVELKKELDIARKIATKRFGDTTSKAATALDASTRALEIELQEVKVELQRRSGYDDIVQELQILKSLEFSKEHHIHNAEEATSLENLLLQKNRRLESELTRAKSENQNVVSKMSQLEGKLLLAKEKEESLTRMVHQLEMDLSNLKLGGLEADPMDRFRTSTDEPGTPGSLTFSAAGKSDGTLLPIVKSQRDRFRQRNYELEEEIQRYKAIEGVLRKQVQTLQDDNAKLFEKIRFLQSFGNGSAQSNRSESTSINVVTDAEATSSSIKTTTWSQPGRSRSRQNSIADMRSLHEEAYSARYEETVNPFVNAFQRFHARERTSRERKLNALDRSMLVVARFVAATQFTRWLFLAYLLILHFLVIWTASQAISTEE